MPRTLAAVLFGFSLLVPSHGASAQHGGFFVFNEGEAKANAIWLTTPSSTPNTINYTTYAAAEEGAQQYVTYIVAAYRYTECSQRRVNYQCLVTAVTPTRDPFEHDPRMGVLYDTQHQCATVIEAFIGNTVSCNQGGPVFRHPLVVRSSRPAARNVRWRISRPSARPIPCRSI